MPLLDCFGIASLADRATEDGVEGVESCILIGRLIWLSKNWREFCVPDKSVPVCLLIYEKTLRSGSIHQILVPNRNVCLTWACRKRDFTVHVFAYSDGRICPDSFFFIRSFWSFCFIHSFWSFFFLFVRFVRSFPTWGHWPLHKRKVASVGTYPPVGISKDILYVILLSCGSRRTDSGALDRDLEHTSIYGVHESIYFLLLEHTRCPLNCVHST
jgi:hypothetical protein